MKLVRCINDDRCGDPSIKKGKLYVVLKVEEGLFYYFKNTKPEYGLNKCRFVDIIGNNKIINILYGIN